MAKNNKQTAGQDGVSKMITIILQGKRIKLRCPPKVLTGTLHPSLPSIFSG